MRLKKIVPTNELDLYRSHLKQMINLRHKLVQLARKLDGEWGDGQIAPLFAGQGRPAVAIRFMVGGRWVDNPYFRFFTGEKFFQHEFPA